MSALDLIAIPIVLFALLLCALIGYLIMSSLSGTALDIGNTVVDGQALFRLFDQLGVLVVFGIALAAFVSGMFVRSHPIFFIIMIIVLIPTIIISVAFSNLTETLLGTTQFSGIAAQFPLTSLLFPSLPAFTVILGAILGIVLFGKDAQGLAV